MRGEYRVCPMTTWQGVEADLVITDPPFGIEFDGKRKNYNRDVGNVVDGYVEWPAGEYREKIRDLLGVIQRNLNSGGQALVFSGWQNSRVIHQELEDSDLYLRGKLYWSYNFAPYCKLRPAHNIYEIFWATRDDTWYYDNTCEYDHCQRGEANLSLINVKRDYKKNMPKYPTRLPLELLQVLLSHFSREDDLVFDPLGGSGMVGIAAEKTGRRYLVGDLNENGRRVFHELLQVYGLD